MRWRINCAPNKLLDNLKKIIDGTDKLEKGLRKPHNRQIFDGIKKRGDDREARNLLYKLLKGIDPKFDKRLKSRAFRTWKSKVPDTDKLRNKMTKMLHKYVTAPKPHNKLIREPQKELTDMMKQYHLLKQNKVKPLSEFCRSL